MGISVVLDQGFEVYVKVGQNPCEQGLIGRNLYFELLPCELSEDIAPTAVAEKKQLFACSTCNLMSRRLWIPY